MKKCESDATFYSDALILPLAASIEKLQYVKVKNNGFAPGALGETEQDSRLLES